MHRRVAIVEHNCIMVFTSMLQFCNARQLLLHDAFPCCKMRIRKRERYRKASTHTQNKQQLCDRENFCNAKGYKYFGIILNFLYLYIR